MSKHEFKVDAKCADCNGTGLYIGFAYRDGAAVVCGGCGGAGHRELKLQWEDFDKRRRRQGVQRVYQANPGIGIGTKSKDKEYSLEMFGGITYKDWLKGEPFPRGSEMRAFTCPAWWWQTADSDQKPDWDECQLGGTFSSCPHFGAKDKCWARWDAENPE